MDPSVQSRFLLLPGELRNEIYNHLAPSLGTNIVNTAPAPSLAIRDRYGMIAATTTGLEDLMLLLPVNKQLRKEVSALLLRNRTIVFYPTWHGEHDDTIVAIRKAKRWLDCFDGHDDASLGAITHFRVLFTDKVLQSINRSEYAGLDIRLPLENEGGDVGSRGVRVDVFLRSYGERGDTYPAVYLHDSSWERVLGPPPLDDVKWLRRYAARAVVYLTEVQAEGRGGALDRDDFLNLMRLATGKRYWKGWGLPGYSSVNNSTSKTKRILSGEEKVIEKARRRVRSAGIEEAMKRVTI